MGKYKYMTSALLSSRHSYEIYSSRQTIHPRPTEEERKRKEEELRRLKNLKREEIRARLDKIQQISGGGTVREGGDS